MIKMKPDYKGFVLEVEERTVMGLPIDITTLREMATKHGTPVLSGCMHSDSSFSEWEIDPDFLICGYCGAMKYTR